MRTDSMDQLSETLVEIIRRSDAFQEAAAEAIDEIIGDRVKTEVDDTIEDVVSGEVERQIDRVIDGKLDESVTEYTSPLSYRVDELESTVNDVVSNNEDYQNDMQALQDKIAELNRQVLALGGIISDIEIENHNRPINRLRRFLSFTRKGK